MKIQRLWVVVGVIIVLFVLSSQTIAVNSNSIVVDEMDYYIQTNKVSYALGEDVELLFKITNLKNEERRYEDFFPLADFTVEQEIEGVFSEIWHWSWNKVHPDGPILIIFAPNEIKELNGTWPQIDLHGSVNIEYHTQVLPGTYRISGVFYPTDTSVSVDITVVPEPCSIALFMTGTILFNRFSKKN